MPPLLNWIVIALSLINTILLIWLGLTVALNAERRTWGVWLISGGLLLGGVFFVSHTAILGFGLTSLDQGIDFWWHLGLLAALILPYLWYVVVLWYAGFWEDRQSGLYRRHRLIFPMNSAITFLSIALLCFANPFPSLAQVVMLQLTPTLAIGDVPLMVVAYMASTLLNVGLSLGVLRRPGPARRIMGNLARDRAKPWLLATSAMLMLVGALIAGVMIWVALRGNQLIQSGLYINMTVGVTWFDLAISGLITLAVLFLGQAIVRYEVFTGKTLPQRRFMRHWRNIVMLAIACGFVMSAALVRGIQPVYVLLVMAILVTAAYALFSQNSYAERERYIQHLRPFVASQHLYDHLLNTSEPLGIVLYRPFETLCRDVLGTKVAYLVAVGPLAGIVGSVLVFPQQVPAPVLPLTELTKAFTFVGSICEPVEPTSYSGAHWAVPLWSERGLIGILLLGEKRNGSLYTQEEIEIARASGERMIDTKASAELAQRLMILQRQRLSESHVIDRRTRRVLHDDILPRLHTAMLALNVEKAPAVRESVQVLAGLHREIANLLQAMPKTLTSDMMKTGIITAMSTLMDQEFSDEFEEVNWDVDEAAKNGARILPLLTQEVLFFAAREAVRNAARHGRGAQNERELHLTIQITGQNPFQLTVSDDGVGINTAFSKMQDGHGLALHSTLMAVIGGALSIETSVGLGTRVVLTVDNS
jgi:two-component sensor histidine kinase